MKVTHPHFVVDANSHKEAMDEVEENLIKPIQETDEYPLVICGCVDEDNKVVLNDNACSGYFESKEAISIETISEFITSIMYINTKNPETIYDAYYREFIDATTNFKGIKSIEKVLNNNNEEIRMRWEFAEKFCKFMNELINASNTFDINNFDVLNDEFFSCDLHEMGVTNICEEEIYYVDEEGNEHFQDTNEDNKKRYVVIVEVCDYVDDEDEDNEDSDEDDFDEDEEENKQDFDEFEKKNLKNDIIPPEENLKKNIFPEKE